MPKCISLIFSNLRSNLSIKLIESTDSGLRSWDKLRQYVITFSVKVLHTKQNWQLFSSKWHSFWRKKCHHFVKLQKSTDFLKRLDLNFHRIESCCYWHRKIPIANFWLVNQLLWWIIFFLAHIQCFQSNWMLSFRLLFSVFHMQEHQHQWKIGRESWLKNGHRLIL